MHVCMHVCMHACKVYINACMYCTDALVCMNFLPCTCVRIRVYTFVRMCLFRMSADTRLDVSLRADIFQTWRFQNVHMSTQNMRQEHRAYPYIQHCQSHGARAKQALRKNFVLNQKRCLFPHLHEEHLGGYVNEQHIEVYLHERIMERVAYVLGRHLPGHSKGVCQWPAWHQMHACILASDRRVPFCSQEIIHKQAARIQATKNQPKIQHTWYERTLSCRK
jgi:hypothetical protein